MGSKYINKLGKEDANKKLGPPCGCNKKCRQLVGAEATNIFNAFWDIGSYDKQNAVLFVLIKMNAVKRKYPKKTKSSYSRWNISLKYTVKVAGNDLEVCKKEFMALHGMTTDARLTHIREMINEGSSPKQDLRGKNKKSNKYIPQETLDSIHVSHSNDTEIPKSLFTQR